MTDPYDGERKEALARLAQSREELRRLLEPQREQSPGGGPGTWSAPDGFPRSRTMRMLMGDRGLGAMGAILAGLFIARPAIALRLLHMLPVSAVARALILRAFTSLRAKP
jgi:hypothetical protein